MKAITESPGCWEPDMKRIVKWAAEGAGKGHGLVFCDVRAYVSCREYVGTPQKRAAHGREPRWHRG